MKFTFVKITSLLLLFCCASCGKKEKEWSMEELQQKADSILQPKFEQLQREASDNLDKRRSIELKPMVDSLLNRNIEIPPVPILDAYQDLPSSGTAATPIDTTL